MGINKVYSPTTCLEMGMYVCMCIVMHTKSKLSCKRSVMTLDMYIYSSQPKRVDPPFSFLSMKALHHHLQ